MDPRNYSCIWFRVPLCVKRKIEILSFHPENHIAWIDHQVKRDKIKDRAFFRMVRKLAQALYWNCDMVIRPQEALLLYPQFTAERDQRVQRHFYHADYGKRVFLESKYWRRVDSQRWKKVWRLRTRMPRHPEMKTFEYAARLFWVPVTSTGFWKPRHLYAGEFPFEGRSAILDAAKERLHWGQSAGMVLLHPLVAKLWNRCGSLVMALRGPSLRPVRV